MTTVSLVLTIVCAAMSAVLQSTVTSAQPVDSSNLAHRIQARGGSGVLLVPYPRVGKRSSVMYSELDRESFPHLFTMFDSDQVDGEDKRGYLTADVIPESEVSGYLSTLRFGKRSDPESDEIDDSIAQPYLETKRLLMARVGKRFLHAARVG